ncbi:hypothetical protein GQ53DRAFT_762935 [Thozetella sp. PMI_491]|nr:hypothetical protein GQ53DRAFT_762935 [Thozetella sp. PMI_491]
MSTVSDAPTSGPTEGAGAPRKVGTVMLRVHSSFISQRQLSQGLEQVCKTGTFKAEMRHNMYMIYLNREDVAGLKEYLFRGYQFKRAYWQRPGQQRWDIDDNVSDDSDCEEPTPEDASKPDSPKTSTEITKD